MGLNGQPLEGENNHLGKILSNMLAYSSSGPFVKFMDWARDLYAGNPINVDRTDSDVLEAFIKESQLPNLTKEQLIDVIKAPKPILKKK